MPATNARSLTPLGSWLAAVLLLCFALQLPPAALAQAPYRLANCYSFSSASAPLDLQGTYADNTLEACANTCSVFGQDYFGVSGGTDCYCGNSVYDDITSPECFGPNAIACPGATFEDCGADSDMTIYGNPAVIGDCPADPIDGIGADCNTVFAGAAPSGGPTTVPVSSPGSTAASASATSTDTADRSGSSISSTAETTPTTTPISTPVTTPVTTSSSSESSSVVYISTTDSNGSPTVTTSFPDASRTGTQTDDPLRTTSPNSTGTITGTASVCSPTTVRSALVDGNGSTISIFPEVSAGV